MPRFKDLFRYSGSVLIEFYNKELKNNKPIYSGATVLEQSKLYLYEICYNFLQPFVEDLQLFFMNTESFILSLIKALLQMSIGT